MFASVEQYLARVNASVVRNLLELEETDTIDETRIASALTDASAELQAKLDQLPEGRRPKEATLLIHCVKVATYLLTLGNPAKETEQIRNAYTDTMAFYDAIIASSSPSAGGDDGSVGIACAPPRIFTERSLKGHS